MLPQLPCSAFMNPEDLQHNCTHHSLVKHLRYTLDSTAERQTAEHHSFSASRPLGSLLGPSL
jgi:hypothetical protein